jgi:hypothetical protein
MTKSCHQKEGKLYFKIRHYLPLSVDLKRKKLCLSIRVYFSINVLNVK